MVEFVFKPVPIKLGEGIPMGHLRYDEDGKPYQIEVRLMDGLQIPDMIKFIVHEYVHYMIEETCDEEVASAMFDSIAFDFLEMEDVISLYPWIPY